MLTNKEHFVTYLSNENYIPFNALRHLFLVAFQHKISFFFPRMPHQPSGTGTVSRHGVQPSPVADNGRQWQAFEKTTPTTLRPPKPPVTHTTVNVPNFTADDPEFAQKVWAYINSQIQRLQGTNGQSSPWRMRFLNAFTLTIITTTIIITILLLLLLSVFFLGGRRGTRTPKHFVNLTGERKNFKMMEFPLNHPQTYYGYLCDLLSYM
jgi:hypothetical protein